MRHRTLLDELLCTALIAGVLLVALVPGARASAVIGWLPMWLVAMPALAWWALHGFALPQREAVRAAERHPARRVHAQARRSPRPMARQRWDRAA